MQGLESEVSVRLLSSRPTRVEVRSAQRALNGVPDVIAGVFPTPGCHGNRIADLCPRVAENR
jgi:hypothetical protein